MSLDTLRDKIHAKADSALQNRIGERLRPIRQAVNLDATVATPNNQYTVRQLINQLGTQAFNERRDQNRAQAVARFIEKVGDIEP